MSRTNIVPIVAVAATAVLVAGCTNSRINFLNTQPAPLTPAPSGTVSSGQLPPPSAPQASGQNGFPSAPATSQPVQSEQLPPADGTEQAAAGTDGQGTDSSVQQVASTEPVTRETMVGAWRVSTEGANCQMFMALTKWSTGFRAASRGCPGDAAEVSSWNVDGSQVVLSDSGGNKVATLFRSGETRFDGQTVGGRSISLAR
ncbi:MULTISPECIES: AprI/Inh family metalloprotease inhibitor [unclassified Roseitalea]|uniref:AprI/Inh family metalloprotease inhibitor n=1 Tax=unclassified Roseitalea TaxID=2639107 RepID=UPI00273DCE18|nr:MULTISPECIES: AprI/Inh family metalloprotease inhibitor [unclassified Roseitalea]